jgi:hypothetical protein
MPVTNKKTEQDFADAAHEQSMAWARLKTPELGKGQLEKIGWTDEARAAALEARERAEYHQEMGNKHGNIAANLGRQSGSRDEANLHEDAANAHFRAADRYNSLHQFYEQNRDYQPPSGRHFEEANALSARANELSAKTGLKGSVKTFAAAK